jgi:hypothetical protein
MDEDSHAKELKMNLQNPWKVTSECEFIHADTEDLDTDDVGKEITMLSDLPYEYESTAALICNLLIGGKVNFHLHRCCLLLMCIDFSLGNKLLIDHFLVYCFTSHSKIFN